MNNKVPKWLKKLTRLSLAAPICMAVIYTLPALPEPIGRAALYITSLSYTGGIPVAITTQNSDSHLSDINNNGNTDLNDASWVHGLFFDGTGQNPPDPSTIPYEEVTETITPPTAAATDTQEPDPVVEAAVKPKSAGNVQRKFYQTSGGNAYIGLSPGFIKNSTKLSNASIQKNVANAPKFSILADGTPEVLIMHTHATEGYQPTLSQWYDKTDTTRTTDNTKNTTRVGDEIAKQLKNAGIGVIQDKTLHDYPSYNGAYERSAETVKRILKENPTIKVVLDVHRDAIQQDASTMVAPVAKINGKDCAQVMIISGCDDGTMNMPNYMENLKLSAALQREMETKYAGLARPILFDYRKYNQNLTTGSILLEMGGHANTLDEAIYCGELVGKSLASTLIALK